MENFPGAQPDMNNEEPADRPDAQTAVAIETIVYPPRFEKQGQTVNVWLKSILSLAAYLLLGYYIFKRWELLLLITAVVIFHELGHFFAMKLFRYNDLGIFFIPLLGAYVSGTKREVSQRESAIILLAGPLPGIILGIIFYFLWQNDPYLNIAGISFYTVSLLLIILNLFNLLPVYPLDGGQLLNRVFFNEETWLSRIFIFLSIGLLSWFAWKTKFPVLYIFPALMVLRLFAEKRMTNIEKRIEAEGINTDLEYADLPPEDYWKIRNILIQEHPSFSDVEPSPPYEYSHKEEKIMAMIQTLLHRHLIQDVSVIGKILIFLIWAAALASPWLLKMDMSIFNRFGL
jgi:stage IV sporulation protein FB